MKEKDKVGEVAYLTKIVQVGVSFPFPHLSGAPERGMLGSIIIHASGGWDWNTTQGKSLVTYYVVCEGGAPPRAEHYLWGDGTAGVHYNLIGGRKNKDGKQD